MADNALWLSQKNRPQPQEKEFDFDMYDMMYQMCKSCFYKLATDESRALIEIAEYYDDNDSRNYWGNTCHCCDCGHFKNDPVIHKPDCPYLVAKRVLSELAIKTIPIQGRRRIYWKD